MSSVRNLFQVQGFGVAESPRDHDGSKADPGIYVAIGEPVYCQSSAVRELVKAPSGGKNGEMELEMDWQVTSMTSSTLLTITEGRAEVPLATVSDEEADEDKHFSSCTAKRLHAGGS